MEKQFITISGQKLIPISNEYVDLYIGDIPMIGNRYYHDTVNNTIMETSQNITQYRILLPSDQSTRKSIFLTYLIQVNGFDNIYKPKKFEYDDINHWIDLIYTWKSPIVGDMSPVVSFNKFAVTRKTCMISDHQVTNYHYHEAINYDVHGCIDCLVTGFHKTPENELDTVVSTNTSYIYNSGDIHFTFSNDRFCMKFNPYVCPSCIGTGVVKRYNDYCNHISYRASDDEVDVGCPSMEKIDPSDASYNDFHIHKGKIFEKVFEGLVESHHNYKTHVCNYPRWVTDDTIWSCNGLNGFDVQNGIIYCDYATGSIDFTGNQLAHEIREHCLQLSKFISTLMPIDKKKIVLNPADIMTQTQEHDDVCGICLENENEGDEWVKLNSCKHKYHKNCIIPHLIAHMKCPYCMAYQRVASEPSISMDSLLVTFTEKMPLIESNIHYQRLSDIIKRMKLEQFRTLNCHRDMIKYYEMYKDEYMNTRHIFMCNMYSCVKLRTLVNGYIITYTETCEKLMEICRKTWPDREIVIIPEKVCDHVVTPTDIITVTKCVS